MLSSSPVPPLSPMPVWLRLLGVGVCFAPLMAALVSFAVGSKSVQEFIGGIVYLMVMFFAVVVIVSVPLLVPPVFWGIGSRPGALGCSGYLIVAGVGCLLEGSDIYRQMGVALMLHIPLLGVLAWEWRAAIQSQRRALEFLPPI